MFLIKVDEEMLRRKFLVDFEEAIDGDDDIKTIGVDWPIRSIDVVSKPIRLIDVVSKPIRSTVVVCCKPIRFVDVDSKPIILKDVSITISLEDDGWICVAIVTNGKKKWNKVCW